MTNDCTVEVMESM